MTSSEAHGLARAHAIGVSRSDVLLLAYCFPPDTASGAARPYRFSKYLQKIGHRVEVISAHAKPGVVHLGNVHRVEGDFDQDARSFPWYCEKLVRGLCMPHDEGVRWARDVVPVAGALFAGKQPVIVSTAPPLTPHLAAARLKSKYGWKWVADFRDPLSGNPYRPAAVARLVDPFWEKFIFSRADQIIANTDVVANLWKRQYPQFAEKIHLVWNGFDPDGNLNALPVADGPAVLRHVGTIYGDRFPTPLIAALEAMFAEGALREEAFALELAGPMHLSEGMTVPPANWLRITPEVARAEADRLTASAHYLLLLDVIATSNPMQVPGKVYDYVRVGRPILAVTLPGSPVERILKQAGIPAVFVHPTDSQEVIQRKVAELAALPATVTPYSAWFADNFDGERQAATLSALIQKLG